MTKSRRSSKQNGNMFVGLVLGLIAGLAIAIAVALYITRAPGPIAPKNPSENPTPQNASSPINPNFPLQGQHPAEPAPQASSASASSSAASEQAQSQPQDLPQTPLGETQIIEVPLSSPERALERALEADQSAASGAVSSYTRPQTPEASDTALNIAYYLQAGTFVTRAGAEAQRARLALHGVEAKVIRHHKGYRTYYRVRAGPFAQFDRMQSIRRQLSQADIRTRTAVIRFREE